MVRKSVGKIQVSRFFGDDRERGRPAWPLLFSIAHPRSAVDPNLIAVVDRANRFASKLFEHPFVVLAERVFASSERIADNRARWIRGKDRERVGHSFGLNTQPTWQESPDPSRFLFGSDQSHLQFFERRFFVFSIRDCSAARVVNRVPVRFAVSAQDRDCDHG